MLAAYTDAATGKPLPELDQALALLIWAWFILSVIFTIAATRTSWSLLLALLFYDLELMLLAVGYTVGNDRILIASRGVGFMAAFCACQFIAPFSFGSLQLTEPPRLVWRGRTLGKWSNHDQFTNWEIIAQARCLETREKVFFRGPLGFG